MNPKVELFVVLLTAFSVFVIIFQFIFQPSGLLLDIIYVFDFGDKIDQVLERLSVIDKIVSTLLVSNGTASLAAGWESPRKVVIDVSGNSTLYDSKFVQIVVYQ